MSDDRVREIRSSNVCGVTFPMSVSFDQSQDLFARIQFWTRRRNPDLIGPIIPLEEPLDAVGRMYRYTVPQDRHPSVHLETNLMEETTDQVAGDVLVGMEPEEHLRLQ